MGKSLNRILTKNTLTYQFLALFSLILLTGSVFSASANAQSAQETLDSTVGDWITVIKFWKEPGTLPITSKGSSSIKLNDSGLLHEKATRSEVEKGNGSDLTIVFDKEKKTHSLVLKDTIGTLGNVEVDMTGIFEPNKKSFTFSGIVQGKKGKANPKEPGDETPIKLVIKNIRYDSFKKELWLARRDGREAKILEVEYKRN